MPSYERYETRRRQTYGSATGRSAWGYWIPLIVTVGVATAGVAAWIWNERKDDDDDDDQSPHSAGQRPQMAPTQDFTGPPTGQPNLPSGSMGPATGSIHVQGEYGARNIQHQDMEEDGIVSRVSGALRRTPSPQQIFDVASKRVSAGVAAAGAVVGGALASITEEGKGDYEDHSRWSEEADSQNGSSKVGVQLRDSETALSTDRALALSSIEKRDTRKRKTVAIVVSAEKSHEHEEDAGYHQEHASILSHLPEHIDEVSRVFVLIYDPNLKEYPLSSNEQRTQSTASSYSNIGHEDAQSSGPVTPSRSKQFDTLYTQAKAIVEKESMILPFTSPSSYVQMLRQLSPETVYLQANVAGHHGEHLEAVKSWVGQIVVVVGDDSGHGGLVDSEDERGDNTQDKWWLDDPRIGLGKGIEVVEGLRIGEDWGRRIKGHD